METVAQPVPTLVFQSGRGAVVGQVNFSVEMPVRWGPRQAGQSAAGDREARSRRKRKAEHERWFMPDKYNGAEWLSTWGYQMFSVGARMAPPRLAAGR